MIKSEAYNINNMEAMKQLPDKYYDWIFADPPYFDGPQKLGYYGARVSKTGVFRDKYEKIGTWEVPGYDFYNEIVRVSKNQIIWGINYFPFAGEINGRIIWDKCNDQSSFSKCEIASISSIDTVQQFRFMWNGMMQGKSIKEGHIVQGNKTLNEKRIHPTQKPIALYAWTLKKFCKKGDKIGDTHLGSGSSRIACHELGFDFEGYEIDEKIFMQQEERFSKHIRQQKLFTLEELNCEK